MTARPEQFETLHQLEQEIATFSRSAVDSTTDDMEDFRQQWIPYSGRYNKILNEILQHYARIDYHEAPIQKAVSKAFITYAYDFLDLLVHILRDLEHKSISSHDLCESLDLVIKFTARKETLLNTQYYPKAKEELEAFYNQELREQMDANLKKFLDKHQPKRPYR